MLLALVYGVFLLLVGVTASGLVAVASAHIINSSLSSVAKHDRVLVELFVNGTLRTTDLDAGAVPAARSRELEAHLARLAAEAGMLRLELRSTDGMVLASSQPALRGTAPPVPAELRAAMDGSPRARLVDAAELAAAGTHFDVEQVVQQFLPVLNDARQPLAVVVLWRDAAPLLAAVADAQRDIVIVTLGAAAALAVILFLVFRAAQKRIARQHAQLLEAERRDPLTGLLNHGAAVALLADMVERAKADGARIGLTLVDVDNFRLLNDTHGHQAGDDVLCRVSRLVARGAGANATVARYGPDEFVVVIRDTPAADLQAMLEGLRIGLGEETIQFGESEDLPISVSAGVAVYPDHADAVTDLLSAATVALAEAKAGGGDATRVARTSDEDERAATASFDVLQGLIIAVDTKDRYTKRHSEDVARYAVFLANQMGLDEETRRIIHLAGLLHDVGKIGIPDALLRKPGRLSGDEFEVFKQHVALGDAIVRDVPHAEHVRAGIRHHHERWDGHGYLEGLEGEEIPLVARILAVADAFSAMTTTRPYRKALPLQEALKRLGAAAGDQLEEELVTRFITGIETAADAPLPGDQPAGIWHPQLWVA